jgi:hypothetical protein
LIVDDFPARVSGRNDRLRISPTDISQFVRLEQCERYLRLSLHQRAEGLQFLYDYDVAPQAIPPLLTQSGSQFEDLIEQQISDRLPRVDFSDGAVDPALRPSDNQEVVDLARELDPRESLALFQPRLHVSVGTWDLRGQPDIVRFERTAEGALRTLVIDVKSSTSPKVEHRLQVAFYLEMLSTLLRENGIAVDRIETGILYRGPADNARPESPEERERQETELRHAFELLGVDGSLLEIVADQEAYLESVRDLVTGELSTAQRVVEKPFEDLSFHLGYKCDGCLYNAFCMKRSAERDDLSLLPHLTEQDKRALQRHGVTTITTLAELKELHRKGSVNVDGEIQDINELAPFPETALLTRRLATTWPVGTRLDELIHRAKRYRRWKTKQGEALPYIPHKGYGSLPYSDAEQNPNLIRIYIDAQHDYLTDRLYLVGALVTGNEYGVEDPQRRRSVVRLSHQPPRSQQDEEDLLIDWIEGVLRAIVEVAAPDADGQLRAPIHLIFFDRYAQRVLLEGLARHASTILGATPLYDFVTQLASFDSPLASFLEEEIRTQKNYPMTCQSLQQVAAYLGFDWNEGKEYRELFSERLFDFWGRLDLDEHGERPWYTNRARFNSQIPLEYAYAAWDDLPPPPQKKRDDLQYFRFTTPELLSGFHARRLEAMEWVARDFKGNKQTVKTPFDLPDLAEFEQKARNLAHALDEFVTIERHVELSSWKQERLAPPEQRALAGQTLLVRYLEADQEPEITEKNHENEHRRQLREAYREAYRQANPEASQVRLPKEQRGKSDWSQEGMRFRLRIEMEGIDVDLDEILNLSLIKPGEMLVLCPRWTADSRLPAEEQTRYTPTAKQMLWGMRTRLDRVMVERNGHGQAVRAYADVVMSGSRGGSGNGFFFGTVDERPLEADSLYTLDPDPNSYHGYWASKVVEGLIEGGDNLLYRLLTGSDLPAPSWPEVARQGQERFFAGLDALHASGTLHDFEPSKREFISEHGAAPLLLVQGPPGTGKSYSTAFALFARLQGAMAAGREFRAFLSCKTHAATDVLLTNVLDVQKMLHRWSIAQPEIFREYFDARLLDVPLFRNRPRGDVPDGILPIPRDQDRSPGQPKATEAIEASAWAVLAGTPGSIYGLIKDRWPKALFGHHLADCLVLDEASQMNLPEAIMAALPLPPDGRVIVVGDHRQMPPIVQHDWANEPRRTFREYRSYESLFEALLPLDPPMIKFEESFRLHTDLAEFLRREIYVKDGINYHSKRTDVILEPTATDDFVTAVLTPEHPLIVVVHDETASQVRNEFEQKLIAPVLEVLADQGGYALDPVEGLGVVVPHRAQRAALQEAIPALTELDPVLGTIQVSAVDTVERFQGGERTVILVGATESDREYLLVSSKFLLDPRRLTVALSRAKRKMVLVASRSIFELFSADEETFANAQLWKNLLRRTCTVKLWEGSRNGHHVEVWGNPSTRVVED